MYLALATIFLGEFFIVEILFCADNFFIIKYCKMKKIYPFLFLIICSCVQPSGKSNSEYADSLKAKENELLKRELALKEKELEESKKQLDASSRKNLPISELYKEVKQGVFIVYAQGTDNISQGTGFFLNSSGVAISNYHVFENADKAIVILDNGEKCLINKIISYDKDLDYVIFQVDNQFNSCYPLQVSQTLPEIGSTCFAIGNPEGLTQTLSIGNISGYRENNNLIQTTTEITHGSSGGPLFNSNGEVVGITSSGLDEANLNFALNISKVPYNIYSSQKENIVVVEKENIPTETIKSTIKKYYTTYFNRDYATLQYLYTPTLDRFFDEFNLSSTKVIEKAKDYWKMFNVLSANNNIHWETLKITQSPDGDFYVTYNMDFYLQRAASKKDQSFNLDIILTLTNDMKIKSIYENIIHHE